MTISAGTAFVDIIPNLEGFASEVAKGVQGAASQISSSATTTTEKLTEGASIAMVGLGIAAVGAIGKGISATTEWATQIRQLQGVTGQTAEEASGLAGAASSLGISVSALSVGMGTLARNIQNGSTNLEQYGIRTKDVTGTQLPFDDILANITDKYAALPNQMAKAAFAQNVFGRSGKQLIPLLAQGSAGLAELEAKAGELGLTMSQDDVDAAKALTNAQHELGDAFRGMSMEIGKDFIPVATAVVRVVTSIVKVFQLVPQPIVTGVAAFLALNAATILVGKAGKIFSSSWGILQKTLGLTTAATEESSAALVANAQANSLTSAAVSSTNNAVNAATDLINASASATEESTAATIADTTALSASGVAKKAVTASTADLVTAEGALTGATAAETGASNDSAAAQMRLFDVEKIGEATTAQLALTQEQLAARFAATGIAATEYATAATAQQTALAAATKATTAVVADQTALFDSAALGTGALNDAALAQTALFSTTSVGTAAANDATIAYKTLGGAEVVLNKTTNSLIAKNTGLGASFKALGSQVASIGANLSVLATRAIPFVAAAYVGWSLGAKQTSADVQAAIDGIATNTDFIIERESNALTTHNQSWDETLQNITDLTPTWDDNMQVLSAGVEDFTSHLLDGSISQDQFSQALSHFAQNSDPEKAATQLATIVGTLKKEFEDGKITADQFEVSLDGMGLSADDVATAMGTAAELTTSFAKQAREFGNQFDEVFKTFPHADESVSLLGESMDQFRADAVAAAQQGTDAWNQFSSDTLAAATQAWNAFKDNAVTAITFADDRLADLTTTAQQAKDTLSQGTKGLTDAEINKLKSDAQLTASEIIKSYQTARKKTVAFSHDLLEISKIAVPGAKDLAQSYLDAGNVLAAQVIADAPKKLQEQAVESFRRQEDAADGLGTKLTNAIKGPLDTIARILKALARQWNITVPVKVTGQNQLTALQTQLARVVGVHNATIVVSRINSGRFNPGDTTGGSDGDPTTPQAKGGIIPGLAAGGLVNTVAGFITRVPTILTGEGSSMTPLGRGAEAILPLQKIQPIVNDAVQSAINDVISQEVMSSSTHHGAVQVMGELKMADWRRGLVDLNGELEWENLARSA